MDAFFASIEQRDNPAFRGKPLAVGYSGQRGVVAAASYEARKFGVRSAMPSVVALRKCPGLTFAPPRFEAYREASALIHHIFTDYTDLVEPLSLDEAFLDVTVNKKNNASATRIALEIKQRIKEETLLTASAGVSFNKFLAKIASDYNKPDGLFVITPDEAGKFVEELPIERFFGIGKITAARMHEMNIYTGADLKQHTEEELVTVFGKAGLGYYLNARGIDNREVEAERVRKSLGAESTFLEDIGDIDRLREELALVKETVWERVQKSAFYGKTVTLKAKYADFRQITRSLTVPTPITDANTLSVLSEELLQLVDLNGKKVRLLGLTISNTAPEANTYIQLKIPFKD